MNNWHLSAQVDLIHTNTLIQLYLHAFLLALSEFEGHAGSYQQLPEPEEIIQNAASYCNRFTHTIQRHSGSYQQEVRAIVSSQMAFNSKESSRTNAHKVWRI